MFAKNDVKYNGSSVLQGGRPNKSIKYGIIRQVSILFTHARIDILVFLYEKC